MIVRFTASNVVAMILFIPILLALGLILAFIVPLVAIIVAAVGILFAALYVFTKIGLVKKQQSKISGGSEAKSGNATVEIKEYKVK